ncbi:hypothetical protein LA6_006202 (plasmid) [Marinibacterium anthonyi]|nr:hypothetical protein LA6_006202 [Marinibacterium anthonyi]
MRKSHREELEAIVVDYVEKYGPTDKAHDYFKRLYEDLNANGKGFPEAGRCDHQGAAPAEELDS